MTGSAAADLHNHVNRLHKYSDKLLLRTRLKNTKTLTFPKCKVNTSLRTADVFPVVASLPPKERSDDRKYVCRWQAESIRKKNVVFLGGNQVVSYAGNTLTVFTRIAFPRLIASLGLSPLPRPSRHLLFLLSPPCQVEKQWDLAKLISDDSSSEN